MLLTKYLACYELSSSNNWKHNCFAAKIRFTLSFNQIQDFDRFWCQVVILFCRLHLIYLPFRTIYAKKNDSSVNSPFLFQSFFPSKLWNNLKSSYGWYQTSVINILFVSYVDLKLCSILAFKKNNFILNRWNF